VLALFTGALVLTRGAAKGIKQPITSLVVLPLKNSAQQALIIRRLL
jgi:hypothetical protein